MDDYDYMEGGLPTDSLPADSLQTGPSDPLELLTRFSFHPSVSNVLSADSLSVQLSDEEQSNMMRSIQEIFELEEEEVNEDQGIDDDDDEEEPVVDLEDQQRRTEKLKGVLTTLAQLWWSNSEHMDLAAEKLADGSRDRKSSRYPDFISFFSDSSHSAPWVDVMLLDVLYTCPFVL
jgi:hypothetical protein